MKAYLGIRDDAAPARVDSPVDGRLFGIDLTERNFVRIRLGA
jgi:hypothetical protein